ncbi:hypothetical protein [Endozoicomonas sp. 8E]|uniref:hypothetical protein n=1 Tax=Endozoicomonas sp. 8E TaxID=3035692 RepID=UPI00293949ED|nr:hypothetical protein [Endozoicomonas sp. 8E]WOG27094.1 hypothetical protein P6910_21465 [Endozoicomonas sp. 8E]
MFLLSLSVACQAEPWTGRCAVEFEQKAVFPKQSFSIESGRLTLPGTASDITDAKSHSGSTFAPDDKRHRHGVLSIVELISWQWLYATNLLIAYELILTIQHAPLNSEPYSWPPLETIIAVGWLLKSTWNPDSPLFNPIEQHESSQDQPFATITTMFSSEHNPPQYQPSESPGQQTPKATTQPVGYFTDPLYFDSGDGNEDPQQHLHTLDVNCLVYPCNGVCQFRPSSDNSGPAEWPLNSGENSTGHTQTASRHSSCPHFSNGCGLTCTCHFVPVNATDSQQNSTFGTLGDLSDIECPFNSGRQFDLQAYDIESSPTNSFNSIDLMNAGADSTTNATGPLNDDAAMPGYWPSTARHSAVVNGSCYLQSLSEEAGFSSMLPHLPPPMGTSETQQTNTESSPLRQRQPHLSPTDTAQALSDLTSKGHTGQKTCDVNVVRGDGQQQPCGKVFKNAKTLSNHRNKVHSGKKTCSVTVLGKDNQPQPCGIVCENYQFLLGHKRREHSGQQTCYVKIVGEDGQQQQCRKVFRNSNALSIHKRSIHSGQRICEVIVTGKNGQPRRCGLVCRSAHALSTHKSDYHTGQKTCKVTIVGEDGQQRLCSLVCKNAKTLYYHKLKDHSGQQTCNVSLVGEDGQRQPCGKISSNLISLSVHKRRYHSGQQTCEITVVGENGEQRPCRMVCESISALSDHKKRVHHEQIICDLPVVRENGQPQPCRALIKNTKALSNHKRVHLKRKPFDLD